MTFRPLRRIERRDIVGAKLVGAEVAGGAEKVTGVGAGTEGADKLVVALAFAGAGSICRAEVAGRGSLAVDAERTVVVLDEGVGSGAAADL